MPLLLSIAATSILAMFLSLAAGIAHTFAVTASPSEIIVLPKGATFEGQGSLSRAAVKTIESAPMIAPGSGGHAKPASAEVVHFHDFPRPGGQDEFGATLRGADSVAAMRQFRPDFRLTRGRLFRPGHNELIVGSGIVKINPALVPGRTLPINDDTWTIVGVFHTGRSVDNFTAWADATDLHQTFTHGEPYESVRVRLRASDQLAAFQTYLDKHPQIKAHAERLITYQEISSRNFRNLIILIGVIVEVLLLIAACLGSFYALRALIEARTREVGLFRSLGFKRSSVFGGLLIETIVIVLIGAFVAVAVVAVTFTGQSFYTYNIGGSGTFLLQPRLTPAIVGAAAVAALLLGLIGGIGPAWRAGRLSVAEVLRKA